MNGSWCSVSGVWEIMYTCVPSKTRIKTFSSCPQSPLLPLSNWFSSSILIRQTFSHFSLYRLVFLVLGLHVNGIIQNLLFWIWLLLLNHQITKLRDSFLLLPVLVHSFVLLSNIWLYNLTAWLVFHCVSLFFLFPVNKHWTVSSFKCL